MLPFLRYCYTTKFQVTMASSLPPPPFNFRHLKETKLQIGDFHFNTKESPQHNHIPPTSNKYLEKNTPKLETITTLSVEEKRCSQKPSPYQIELIRLYTREPHAEETKRRWIDWNLFRISLWKFSLSFTHPSDVRSLETNKHFINASTPNVRKARWRRREKTFSYLSSLGVFQLIE